jgi:hypothetical protein
VGGGVRGVALVYVWFVQICGANLSNREEEAETRRRRRRVGEGRKHEGDDDAVTITVARGDEVLEKR